MAHEPTAAFSPIDSDHRRPVRRGPAAVLGRWLEHVFCDRRGAVSRPKLLFAITLADIALVSGAGLMAMVMLALEPLSARSLLTALLVAWAATAALNGLWAYSVSSLRGFAAQVRKVFEALAITFTAVVGVGALLNVPVVAPQVALLWMLMAAVLLTLARYLATRLIGRLTRAGRLVRRTVIVGGGRDGEALIAELERDRSGSLQILGVFDDRMDERSADSLAGYAKLGTFDQLAAFCHHAGVDLLIVALPTTAEERLLHILRRLFTLPCDVRISAHGAKLRLNARAYTHVAGVPMLAVMDKPLSDWDRLIKNIEDRLLGALLLVLLAPVFALVALAVKLDSRGPVFFRQRRYGFNNELIEVYKFRSLRTDLADTDAKKLVTRDDPRVTRVGRFIRRTSLDELPQLINVVKGEMSLVGPRPHAREAKAGERLYHDVVDGYLARHRVKPGLTGWAQINGWRGETDTEQKILRRVEHDLYYIDNWSVPLDLYIIAMTPIALLTGKNAY